MRAYNHKRKPKHTTKLKYKYHNFTRRVYGQSYHTKKVSIHEYYGEIFVVDRYFEPSNIIFKGNKKIKFTVYAD